MKFEIQITHRYKKSLRKIKKSGRFDIEKYHQITDILENGTILPSNYRDHPLSGNWLGYRECHVESDILLIYQVDEISLVLTLVDIGSHPYLFGS